MYVDESGNYVHSKRGGHYYVLSGIIIHELDLAQIERRVREYREEYVHVTMKVPNYILTILLTFRGLFQI